MEQENLLPLPPKKESRKNISQEEGLLPLPPKKKYTHSIFFKIKRFSRWFSAFIAWLKAFPNPSRY